MGIQFMSAATVSHTTRFRRLKIALACVLIGASIGAPIALAFFATAHRHPVTAPPDLPRRIVRR